MSRRAALVGGLGAVGAGLRAAAQPATPDASPVAPPIAIPGATPAPTPTPEPPPPLTVTFEQRPRWSGAPQAGGEIRLFTRVDGLQDFSPTAFRQDFQVTVSYLDPLVWLDEVTLEPRPWLAEEWTWSEDGLELEFRIRDDVRWHDGSPLTSADVAFSLLCYRDDYDSAVWFMFAVVSRIQAIGPRTVRVQFEEPDGAFLFNASNLPVFQRAQYRAWWESKPPGERSLSGFDWRQSPPVGTGPWIVEAGSSTEMRFRRNDDHFARSPHADRLQLTHEPDPDRQLAAWRRDEVDLVWPVDGTALDDLRDEKGTLVAAEGMTSYFAAFNFGNPARFDPGWMASPGIREALTLAIDREAYAEEIFGGFIRVRRAGFMTQGWALDPTVTNPVRNVSAANRILDEQNWMDWNGDGIRTSPAGEDARLVCIAPDDADPGLLAILDRLDGDFQEIGVSLEVQRLAPADFLKRWSEDFDYDLSAWALTQYGAFAEFDLIGSEWSVRRNPGGWNPGGYANPDVDEAIASYLQAWTVADMRAALQTIQRATNEDLFALWLGFPNEPVLLRPDIAGFQPNRMWQSWNTWSLWRTDEDASLATPAPSPPRPPVTTGTPEASPIFGPTE